MEPIDFAKAEPGLAKDGYKVPLSFFLFVNKLEPFQKDVIELFMQRTAGALQISQAKKLIEERLAVLTNAGWKPEPPEGDMVMQPSHYSRFPFEPTTFIMENGINWCLGNALKYICRYPFKNGLQDLRKAIRYLALYERFRSADQEWSK